MATEKFEVRVAFLHSQEIVYRGADQDLASEVGRRWFELIAGPHRPGDPVDVTISRGFLRGSGARDIAPSYPRVRAAA